MKKALVFILVVCVAGIIYLKLDRKKSEQFSWDPGHGSGVIPHQPGVLPKEKAVLDWLERNGCQVKRLMTYNFDNETDGPYDEKYSIAWVHTISGTNNSYRVGGESYEWDSYRDTYDDLIKIKAVIEDLKRTGTVTKQRVDIPTR